QDLHTGDDPYLDPVDVSAEILEPATLEGQPEPGVYVQVLNHLGEVIATSGTLLPIDSSQVAAGLAGRQTTAEVPLTERDRTRVVSQPMPRTGPGSEVGTLARVFNEMVARIDTAFSQQRQFLADTSHELRNPLTVIRGNLGLLRQDLDSESRMVAVLEAEAEA